MKLEALNLIARVCVLYLSMLFLLRISGKRVISQADTFDFVLVLIIGDFFDDVIFAEVAVSHFAAGLGSIVVMQALASVLSYKSSRIYLWLNGKPDVLMFDGLPQSTVMSKQLINEEELESHLRQKSIIRERWIDVRKALLEKGGKVSVILSKSAEPPGQKERML